MKQTNFSTIIAFISIILFNIIHINCLNTHFCGHDTMKHIKNIPIDISSNKNSQRKLDDLSWVPIKIAFDYTYLDTQENSNSELLKKYLSEVVEAFQDLIKIQRRVNTIKIEESILKYILNQIYHLP